MIRSLFPLFGCGLMMLVCMVFMARGASRKSEANHDANSATEVAELRDEVARLRAVDDERRTAHEPSP